MRSHPLALAGTELEGIKIYLGGPGKPRRGTVHVLHLYTDRERTPTIGAAMFPRDYNSLMKSGCPRSFSSWQVGGVAGVNTLPDLTELLSECWLRHPF